MNGWVVALIALVALAMSGGLGAPLTAGLLRLAARSSDASGDIDLEESRPPEADDDPTTAAAPPTRPLLRGGTWIGVLERLAVTGSLLAGYPAGIAFVIAVKGLGRYPELRGNPAVSERFVIGSLTSMLWAVAVGGVARLLVLG